MLVVVETDAVADPGAVMVHANHAACAGGAVMGSWGLQGTTPHAVTPLDEVV